MKKIFTGILALMLFASCNDFLDLKPISESSSPNFYKNANDIKVALNGAYASLQSNNMYRSDYVTLMEVRSDNVVDNNPGGAAGIYYNIDKFMANGDNTVIRDVWKTTYKQIYRINEILDKITVVPDPNLKTQYEGEARFLRALAYFNIVRLWGDAPLLLKPITTQETYSQVRNNRNDIYEAIESDLIFAGQLPKKYTNDFDLGRVTSASAKALLAKVYLTQEKYEDAVTVLEDLINNYTDIYGLQDTPEKVFDITEKMNKEIVFAVRFSKTIPDETSSTHDAYTNTFGLDAALLSEYKDSDKRKTLLSYTRVNSTFVVNKYADTPDPSTNGVGVDFPVLRWADVLLMYAETLNEIAYSNDESGAAFTALNKVRNRATATLYTNTTLTDQNTFREAVLLERRLELALENHRWFDLLRTGKAIEAMNAVRLNITENDLLYPIPESEVSIMNNPTGFPQNPGYN
jgi:tetratricopeptide (TPR) repeat protein